MKMRSHALLLIAALSLGACATAPPAPPQPGPAARADDAPRSDTVAPAPAPITVPAEPLTEVPDRWWLLDPETDDVHGAAVDRAWREVLSAKEPGRTVVVAIIDSGVDIGHEDIDDVLWSNDGEETNGRDDDGNGYVDDVHGWNFIGGPDGRHVERDTYEVTRLHATCLQRYGAGDHAAALPRFSPDEEECERIAADFEAKRRENREMEMQIRQMAQMVDVVVRLLQDQLGTDSLTAERVRDLTPLRDDVRRAREIWLQLEQQGITPAMITEELDRLEALSGYGLNPSFDPRPIVGDDYADPTERHYGNPAVEGPDASHGTGVAGIVAAERDNGIGIDGIASSVRIMSIRAVPDGDERDKDIANAIRYAVDHGAHIINMSFGKAYSPDKAVVDAAVRHADENGVLLVHAAGNDAKDLATEKNFPNRRYEDGGEASLWIEVGASGWEGLGWLAAEFSNYGREQVDIFAPGAGIMSTIPGDDYRAASGTSFAAPVVSGVAALLMAYYPALDAADVRRIILETATPVAEQVVVRPGDGGRVRFGDLSITGAIVNAYAAVKMAERLTAGGS